MMVIKQYLMLISPQIIANHPTYSFFGMRRLQ
eukprot:UN01599